MNVIYQNEPKYIAFSYLKIGDFFSLECDLKNLFIKLNKNLEFNCVQLNNEQIKTCGETVFVLIREVEITVKK